MQYFGHLMQRAKSLEKTLMLGKIEGRRRKGWQKMADWMTSPTQRTWVWASSGRWWKTGKPSVLQSMGSQRVGHNWATEQRHQIRCNFLTAGDLLHLLSVLWTTGDTKGHALEGSPQPEPSVLSSGWALCMAAMALGHSVYSNSASVCGAKPQGYGKIWFRRNCFSWQPVIISAYVHA